MGGQVADKGIIKNEDGKVVAEVKDVQHAPNGQNMHTLRVLAEMKKDAKYRLEVNVEFHDKVKKNHTATHLLDQALRDVLGEHTHQAGSLVEPNYLRFDFTKMGATTPEELEKVEKSLTKNLGKHACRNGRDGYRVGQKLGAIALFTEKYGDTVRVVKAGNYSMEFCGGNHVENTNEIGLFKIVSESGVGAGVRRIEAVTSKEAFEYLERRNVLLKETAAEMKVAQIKEVPHKVQGLQEQIKELENKVSALEDKFASQQAKDVFKNVQTVAGKTLIAAAVKVSGMNQLRSLADQWKEKSLSDVLVLGSASGDKVSLIVAASG